MTNERGKTMILTRRTLLTAAATGAAAAGTSFLTAGLGFAAGGLAPLAKKATYKVGFAQTESNNPWRIAETNSMQEDRKSVV